MISLDAMPIPLANDKGFAWVDANDVEFLSRRNWQLLRPHGDKSKTFYAACRWTTGDKKKTLMHSLLGGIGADHVDRDGLNNTRINLRQASRSQNQFNRRRQSNNTCGFIGVHRTDSKSSWGAYIKINKKDKCLGSFRDAEAAARVRDMWVKEAYGEFASLNFPGGI